MAAAASHAWTTRAGSASALVPRLSAARVPSLLLRPTPAAPCRASVAAAAAAKKGGKAKVPPPPAKSSSEKRPQKEDDEEDDDNVTLIPGGEDDDDDEEVDDDASWFEEIGAEEDDDEGDEDAQLAAFLGGGGDDDDAALADPSKRVSPDGASWGAAALEAARRVLAEEPELNGGGEEAEDEAGGAGGEGAATAAAAAAAAAADDVSLYAFRVLGGGQRIDVRLDSRRDRYGSPTMVQIEAFARAFGPALETAIGVEAAADVAIEVSSPGAERRLELPGDLRRFAALPLRVEYFCAEAASSGKRSLKTAILRILDDGSGPIVVEGEEVEAQARRRPPRKEKGGGEEEEKEEEEGAPAPAAAAATADKKATMTLWRLADVKANAPTKGRGLTRKQRDERLRIPLADLASVRIHVEF